MKFNGTKRPLVVVAMVTLLLLGLTFCLIWLGSLKQMISTEIGADFQFFLGTVIFYIAIWASYFLSPNKGLLRTQSLRVLLRVEATPYQDQSDAVSASREKARASLTAQAIFIAISVFIISTIVQQDPNQYYQRAEYEVAFVLYAALCLVSISLVCLFVSVDASETVFNNFSKETRSKIILYFIKIAGQTKYYGYVLSMLAIIMLIAKISPFIAGIALNTLVLVGYSNWFPAVEKGKNLAAEYAILLVLMLISNFAILAFTKLIP